MVDVSINGRRLEMQVDSAADVSVVNERDFARVCPGVKLGPPDAYRCYLRQRLPVKGECTVDVEMFGHKATLSLVVVKGDYPPLFGLTWIENLPLPWDNWFPTLRAKIAQVREERVEELSGDDAKKKVRALYPKVFAEADGTTIKGFEVDLKLQDGATPIFFPHRNVPIPLRDMVEAELRNMVKRGHLRPSPEKTKGTPIVCFQNTKQGARLWRLSHEDKPVPGENSLPYVSHR